MHHLTAHAALNLDLVGGFQGGHVKDTSLLGAVRALCRNAPFVFISVCVGAWVWRLSKALRSWGSSLDKST